jgi:hypothetical protein
VWWICGSVPVGGLWPAVELDNAGLLEVLGVKVTKPTEPKGKPMVRLVQTSVAAT